MQKIFLVGLPGSGKTTMGLNLAHHLNLQFIDLDLEIEKHENRTIQSIFKTDGEFFFRQLEKKYLEKFIDNQHAFVLATGGGTPCFFENMKKMKREGLTIWINTAISTIRKRLRNDHSRPLLQENSLEDLQGKRKKYYAQAEKKVEDYEGLLTIFSK
ncbi:MAG: shikimate kinase [Bacteroidota bacterium]